MADIAVIIVNYDAGELALAAAQSVLDHAHPGHSVRVHLVDNASPAGDAARLAEAARARGWNGRVTLHLEAVNHGFGRGNNVVLQALAAEARPPDYVFLLNPDAQLENEAIAILADFLDARPRAAVAGARARTPDSPRPAAAAFRFPNMGHVFASAVNFGPVSNLLAHHSVPLDPEYFLYYEEVDLMLRTVRAGWECWHVAEARIVHIEGASTDVKWSEAGAKRRPAYWYHSWQHYFAKNHGRGYALAAAAAWTAGAAIGHVVARLLRRPATTPRRFFGDFWAHGWRPLLGLAPGGR